MAETTPQPESNEPLQPFETTEESKKKFEKLNQEINLTSIGMVFAAERDAALAIDPVKAQGKIERGEPIVDFTKAMDIAERNTGLSPEETMEAAELQNIPLQDMFTRITQNGEPVNDVIKSYDAKRDEAGRTAQQRKTKRRGYEVALRGIERIESGEKELDPKTKEQTLSQLRGMFDLKKQPPKIYTGDAALGEAEDAVVRPGQPGFNRIKKLEERITNPEIADDPERAQMLQDMLVDLGPPTTGSMVRQAVSDNELNKLMGKLSTYDLNKQSRDKNIRRGTKEYDDLKKSVYQNALYEATLLKTTNKFFPPMFVSYDMIDPLRKFPDPASDDDTSWLSNMVDAASDVRVEVVGLDRKGSPIYRLTHPTWHIFEMADTAQMAGAGILERISRGPDDENLIDALAEGSLEGVRNRRDFLKAALSTEMASNSTLGAAAAGFGGFTAAILTPDAFMGVAGVARATKKVATAAKNVRAFKAMAPTLIDELGDGAESLAKAEQIIGDGVADALSAGNYDEALRLLDEAKSFAAKSDKLISQARNTSEDMVRIVDRLDQDIARRLTDEIPEMGGVEGRRVAAKIPGAFGATAENLHPSMRRVELRGSSLDQPVPFPELLNTRMSIEHLQDSIRLLKKGDINEQFLIAYVDEANKFSSKLSSFMSDAKVGTQTAGLTADQRQASVDLISYLSRYKSTRLLRDNPNAWAQEVKRLASKLSLDPDDLAANRKFLGELDKAINATLKSTKQLKSKMKTTVTVADATEATAKATKALRGQFESRAAAMAFVREKVAKQAKIEADPLLVPLTEKHKAIGREGLSPEGLSFLRQIEIAVPGLKGDDALRIIKIEDQKARKWAKKNNSTVGKYYEEQFRLSRVVEGPGTTTKPPPTTTTPTPSPAPTPPTPPPSTAAPPTSAPATQAPLPVPGAPQTATRTVRGAFEGPVGSAPKRVELKFPAPEDSIIDGTTPLQRAIEGAPDLIERRIFLSNPPEPGMNPETLYNYLSQMDDGLDVLKFLLRHGELDSTRAIAKRILPVLEREFKNEKLNFLISDSLERTARGSYDDKKSLVMIRGFNRNARGDDTYTDLTSTGLNEGTILHELIHAATVRYIRGNPNSKEVKALESLSAEIKTGMQKFLDDTPELPLDGSAERALLAQQRTDYIRRIANWDDYYGTPIEMVTFTLTSSAFQEMLRTVKVTPKQSLWNKFTRTVANIFGIKAGDEESALAQALVATEDVLRGSSKFFERPLKELNLGGTTFANRVRGFVDDEYLLRIGTTKGVGGNEYITVGISVKPSRLGPKEMRVKSIELPEELRNTGLGTELYIRALYVAQKRGAAFVSDLGPSPDAMRVYGTLEKYGIKFRRRGASSGDEIVDQFILSADDLKRIDLQDVLNQHTARKTSTDTVFARSPNVASNRVVVERLDDGRIFLRALTDTATADDFIRALGSASRRNLNESDMKALVTWLGGRGVKVSHSGAVFTAKDPTTIERAEDEFAKAYLIYVKSGRADTPEIKGSLNKAAEWLKDTYASATGKSVGGPPPGMDPTLVKTLDKMLRRPSDQVALPNIFKLTRDALFTQNIKGTEIDVGAEILRVTQRLGYPMAKADLESQMTKAAKLYSEGKADQAVIKLPGPVSFGGRAARDEYTLDEILKIQNELESAKHLDMSDTSLLPLGGSHRGVGELSASDMVEQIVYGSKAGGVFKSLYLGGDAYADMRSLPVIVREAIQGGARKVQQAVGETITLVTEKDVTKLMHYLTGKATVQFTKGGRSAVSAGHDSMADVTDSLRKYFEAVSSTPEGERRLEIVTDFCMLVRERGSSAAAIKQIKNRGYDQDELMTAFSEIVRGKKANRFLRESFQAAGFRADDEARLLPEYFTQARPGMTGVQDPGGLLETMLYYADRVPREYQGKSRLFSDRLAQEGISAQRSEATFLRMYEDLNTVFKDDSNVANRVAILIAAHGHAHKAKLEWVGMGIAADEKLQKSINRYFLGEFVGDKDIAEVKRFFQNMGYNPNMVEAFDLYGQKMFIPAPARKRLSMALDQAMDPAIRKQTGSDLWDVLAAPENIIRSGAKGENDTAKMQAALFYRYLKTRMVRGHYILKSKYFWMNTFDHFNQTALTTNYSTAFVSTTRMVTQNLLSNNIGQAFVAAARMTGRGQNVEDVRRVLQDFGDEGAKWAGKLTRSSKWHISVNDILKGGDTIILIGGRPYKANDLRQQFLEAGIFASFDTSQLGTKIQNVGNLFLDEVTKSTSGKTRQIFKDIKDDVKGASEDIAEAWSERERVGLAITLMESGLDPRTAARVTIDALYDYAGSMSKGDRNFLLNIFFPFWAFQKNANRHIFDTIFSPEGAYRLGVMRRFHDKGSDALSELVYSASVDENGVDVDALPPDLRQSYFALKKQTYERLSVDGKVPPLVRHELRMFIAGSTIGYHGGQLLESTAPLSEEISAIADDLRDPKTGEKLPIDRRALAAYYIPRTDRSSMPGHYRDRLSVRWSYTPSDYEETVRDPAVPKEFRDTMKTWLDLYRVRNPDAPYVSLFMPESTYAAAFNYATYLTSSMIMTLQKIEDVGDKWFTEEDDGSDAINPYAGLLALATPERAPVLSDIQAELGLGGNQIPRKMAFAMVYTAQMLNLDVLELDEKDDPFDVLSKMQIAQEEGEEFEPPFLGVGEKAKKNKVYYLMPGIAQAAFVNSPFGEMNGLLLKLERTAPEKAAGLQGRLQQVARGLTGLEIKDISRSKSATQEMFRAKEETDPSVLNKLKSREKLE